MTYPLPTSGPLGKREDYNPTNRDLYDNALKQNGVINAVKETADNLDTKVQTLSITVASHAKVIERLDAIKSTAIWILAFVGLGGVASFANWIKLWLAH